MLRRTLVLLGVVALVCALGVITPRAMAQCAPEPGAGSTSNETITCDGDDADGVNVGSGEDLVLIIDGTVMGRIISEGGTLTVIIDGGELNSSTAGIIITGAGNIIAEGDVTSADYAIIVTGSGTISSTGDVTAGVVGLFLGSSGTITSTGNLNAGNFGVYIGGDGSVTSVGNVTSGVSGIFISKNGEIHSTGTVSGDVHGFFIGGNGAVTSLGTVTGGEFGFYIGGDGEVTSTGDVTGGNFGIFVSGGGAIHSIGDVSGGHTGIFLDEDGTINSTGEVSGGTNGIYLGGDGTINMTGNVEAGVVGIRGGNGAQMVLVDGSVSAPIAVGLGNGNDSLYLRRGSNIQGSILMEEGDDRVIIGDYVVIDSTVVGGETGETVGDLLVIGDGQVCSEDLQAVANAQAINGLDPNSGTVVYLGQTYTWAEFEQIMNGSYFNPCMGSINDGRINAYDLGAPDALYCTVENGVSVWEIDLEGLGTFSFAVNAAQIEAAVEAAVSSGVNQLVGSDAFGNQLYALSDGETLTFVAPELREPGKTYVFTFPNDRCA